MKKLVLACCLFAAQSFAQGAAAQPGEPKPADAKSDSARPVDEKPVAMRHVSTKPDKKGIDDLYKAMDDAMKKGDLEAIANRIDFPVIMMTDTAAGVPSTTMWDRATWIATMNKTMSGAPKDLKLAKKTKVTFITDSLAFIEEDNESTAGKAKDKWVSGAMVQLHEGKWMVKSMIEGGWGDMAPVVAAAAPAKSGEPSKAPATPGAAKTSEPSKAPSTPGAKTPATPGAKTPATPK